MVGCDKDAKKGTDTTADDISIPETQLIPDTTVFEETGKETDDYTSEVKTEQTAPVITEDVDTSRSEETTPETTQPEETLAPLEEIEKVLTAYHEFAEQLIIIAYEPYRDQITQEQWDSLTAAFIRITPRTGQKANGEKYPYPYYALEDTDHYLWWWSQQRISVPPIERGYYVGVNYKATLGNLEDVYYLTFCLDKASMDEFMKAYNISSTILDRNFLANLADPHRANAYKYLDSEIYPQLNIDADLIQNSTSEQLQVLMKVLNALIDININCQAP